MARTNDLVWSRLISAVTAGHMLHESLLLDPRKLPPVPLATAALAAAVHGDGTKVQGVVIRGV